MNVILILGIPLPTTSDFPLSGASFKDQCLALSLKSAEQVSCPLLSGPSSEGCDHNVNTSTTGPFA